MTAKQHTLIGGIAALALSPILGLGAIPFWMGSVLIDIDHYLEYIYHNRLTNFSVKGMYDYHNTLGGWFSRPAFLNLSIFHTVEVLSLFLVLSFWIGLPWLKAATWGMLLHVFLDIVYLYRKGYPNKRAHFIIEFFIRKEIMKQQGFHPSTVCNEAIRAIYRKGTKKETCKMYDTGG